MNLLFDFDGVKLPLPRCAASARAWDQARERYAAFLIGELKGTKPLKVLALKEKR
jgi:hypothetical protein